jgi:NAD(P)-dependent dehydrogenase (short-subunit alcohol dehydrogenase family)
MYKFALVTGSTKGIGLSIGFKLLQKGYYVFFSYSSDDANVKALNIALSKFDGRYSVIKTDLSNFESVNMLSSEIFKVASYIDCIVLNAGMTCKDSFNDISIFSWNKVINTNLTVPFFLLKALSPIIRTNGRIIFIGSILGSKPHGVSTIYSVTKSSLNMLCKSLVKIFKSRKITVNLINAGFINTAWHSSKSQEHLNRIKDKIALKRLGRADEVADLCMHIIDNEYINGSCIDIDGGYDLE